MIRSQHQCPYCNGSMLRHIRHGELYWFCTSCRQEGFSTVKTKNLYPSLSPDLKKHLIPSR